MFRKYAPMAVAAASGVAASSVFPWPTASSESAKPLVDVREFKVYHSVLQSLSSIKSCHEAVNHPSGNLAWDFGKNKSVPGRIWEKHAPEHLKASLSRPFTEEEKQAAKKVCRLTDVPCTPKGRKPQAVFVLGPSGAGKSTLCKKGLKVLFTEPGQPNSPEDFVEIDGDVLRLAHGGYQEAVADPHVGYKDLMKLLGSSRKELKQEILKSALESRQNLLIPDTGMDEMKVEKMFNKLLKEGYEIHMIGLIISHAESCDRQINRAHETGRWPSKGLAYDMWEQSLLTIKKYAQPHLTRNAIVFDNTDFSNAFVIFSRSNTLEGVASAVDNYQKQAASSKL
mmetsp:Transcript_13365/g.22571  ORF Transcript_13365/g.22571 Transcript_13365/m.22571 type:complete len:339 (+) Transcript_13365:129-1145(+)|eukprot:CAMPEP_0198210864 /NCGR_PEP_ID=MMETSP1445-20131203/22487_1 /TAXON_ID=36898 /ORGANISM="Pyramimonas sp., Strain CCMP2087" /LENGTH=338 /DNA_ID=CAMNT_0043885023 /DNA_START=126 /DNA_END=1142 /DNA_ORIENTATION=+